MREIKFRAYDKKENEMFYSNIYQDKTSMIFGLSNFLNECSDIEDTLMQYTGLKDKNNVEIYEGDILKVLVAYTDYDGFEYKRPSRVYNHRTKYVNIAVSFESGTFILDTDYTDSLYHTLWLWTQEDVEVIGNIYENKELLNN